MRHLSAAVLVAVVSAAAAHAADPPQVAEQKRLYQQVYNAAHAHGVCDVYQGLTLWQPEHWPAGKPALEQLLRQTILPTYAAGADLQGKTREELEAEYRKMCDQARDLFQRAMDDLQAQPADDPLAAQRKQFGGTLVAARFLGQCQTVSAVYLRTGQEQHDAVAPFVRDEVLAKDDRYRGAEAQYWKDCDSTDAEIQKILAQLKPAP